MSYNALVVRAQVVPHPNADRLKIVHAAGFNVISTSVKDGELCIFFPSDGQFSHEYLYENSEYRHSDLNKDPNKKGYFEDNRRIRMIRLRGEWSEGYIAPLSSVAYTGVDLTTLTEGFTFTSLNGREICDKYYSKATQEAIGNREKVKKKLDYEVKGFYKHFDTKQFKAVARRMDELDFTKNIVSISVKMHGTSGRTGYLPVTFEVNTGFKGFLNRFLPENWKFMATEYKWISGSRNVDYNPFRELSDPYRARAQKIISERCEDFAAAHPSFKYNELPNITFFYEIVGYDGQKPLFSHNLSKEDKKEEIGKLIYKNFGDNIHYTYGWRQGESEFYIYRITIGERELNSSEMNCLCLELGLKTVESYIYRDNRPLSEHLKAKDNATINSLFSLNHPEEGWVIRIDNLETKTTELVKYKSSIFCWLEDIMKYNDNYVDIEEIS